MRRILFVDDEPKILEGLERQLFEYADEWQMAFVGSGAEALERMAREPFDVLVTDMRMPGMDGAALLRAVQDSHPHVVRIVLSGYSELALALRTVPVAHQFLTKPCDPAVLKEVLDRACRLQQLVGDETVRSLIGRALELPARPAVFAELTVALANDETSIQTISSIIEKDIAITSNLVRLVNSAFFAPRMRITKLSVAVARLGASVVKDLVLSIEIFREFARDPQNALQIDRMQDHVNLVANIAKRLPLAAADADDAFLAGLLHDIGRLVMLARQRALYSRILQQAAESGRPSDIVEYEVLGASHAEIGGYLLGIWGLPYPIVEAVACHHMPERLYGRGLDIATATYVADRLAREGAGGPLLEPAELACLGIQGDLARWRAVVKELGGDGRGSE